METDVTDPLWEEMEVQSTVHTPLQHRSCDSGRGSSLPCMPVGVDAVDSEVGMLPLTGIGRYPGWRRWQFERQCRV